MIETSMVAAFIIGLIVLVVAVKLLSLPLQLLWKFATNSLLGAIMLWFCNLFGMGIEIGIINSFIAGAFGIPGVIAIILFHYFW